VLSAVDAPQRGRGQSVRHRVAVLALARSSSRERRTSVVHRRPKRKEEGEDKNDDGGGGGGNGKVHIKGVIRLDMRA